MQQHGVAFTLTVQARSNVHLAVRTSQTSRRPGGTATILATLTDFGIPLASSAAVTASVDIPGGSTLTLALDETEPGIYTAGLPTPVAGIYRVLVSAQGSTLHAEPFTREELRTLAVWHAGDDRPPSSTDPGRGTDLCDLLNCILEHGTFDAMAKRAGIDLDPLRKCVHEICR